MQTSYLCNNPETVIFVFFLRIRIFTPVGNVYPKRSEGILVWSRYKSLNCFSACFENSTDMAQQLRALILLLILPRDSSLFLYISQNLFCLHDINVVSSSSIKRSNRCKSSIEIKAATCVPFWCRMMGLPIATWLTQHQRGREEVRSM